MNFTVTFKTPTGRSAKINCIAPSFDECLKKISAIYGKNLVSISYEPRKNSQTSSVN